MHEKRSKPRNQKQAPEAPRSTGSGASRANTSGLSLKPEHTLAPLPGVVLLLVLMILLAYRIFTISNNGLPLHYDEAQYYGWSLASDWGYYSKPPMIAWAIAAAREVCGEGEACVRLPSSLAFSFTAIWLAMAAWTLTRSGRAALYAGIIIATAPLVSFYSTAITTDSMLLFWWSLALWAFAKATGAPPSPQRFSGLAWWLLTGFAAGMGLLSKYTMGVFAVSALIWLASDRDRRRWLLDWRPYFGVIVAAACFAPNVIWNLKNGFATLSHTAEISTAGAQSRMLEFKSLAEFGLAQPFLLGIVFAVAIGFARLGPVRSRSTGFCFAWTFAWPMLVIISVQALATRAHANWAAAAHLGLALAAAIWLAELSVDRARRWLIPGLALNALVFFLIAHGPQLVRVLPEPWRSQNPYTQLKGWKELGAEVARELEAGRLALLATERRDLSELIYYARPSSFPAWVWNPEGRRNDHYRLLYDIANDPKAAQKAYLFVGRVGAYDEELLKQQFEHVELRVSLNLPVDGQASQRFRLFRVEGYRQPIGQGAQPNRGAGPS